MAPLCLHPSSAAVAVLLFIIFVKISGASSQPQPPEGTLIDCGTASASIIDGRVWLPDAGFISSGTPRIVMPVTLPTPLPPLVLSTVRSFPLQNYLHRKFCYTVNVTRGARYMVRSTYFYGGANNGQPVPPVFDQIVDGTLWGVVNTTDDYAMGMASYYEGIFQAKGKTMSFCLGANSYTESDPFISALEFIRLGNSLYNSTDFGNYSLSLVARNAFGSSQMVIRFPDDQFDRYWQTFGQNYSTQTYNSNVSVSGFWNLPPLKAFETQLTTPPAEPMELQWPRFPLQNSTYYIALYFADDLSSSSGGGLRRLVDITINDIPYYRNLSVTSEGVAVFASRWLLSGLTKMKVAPAAGSFLGPLINAAEIFELLPLGRRTHTRDVIALGRVKNSFQNPPQDWSGDPCLPRGYSWTGVTCTEGRRVRVVALNLTGMNLLGTVSHSLAELTALNIIALGNNRLTGTIPDLNSLMGLEILHLNDNQLTGSIPSSLGTINSLRELFLQNNNLTGAVPNTLVGKPGLDLRVQGNNITSSPPSR